MKKSRIRLIVLLLSIILLGAILALVLAPPSASFEENKGTCSNISTVTTDKEYTIKGELPDVKEKDIQVTLKDDILIIKAEKKKEKQGKNKSVFSS